MRFLVALFAGLCAVAAVSVHNDLGRDNQRQEQIYQLFKFINQPSYYPEFIDISKNYDFYQNIGQYSKPEVVEEFYHFYRYGTILQRGEIFSVFHKEHLKQAIALFKLFYYANDFETFYNTAVWARNNVNEGLFLYAVSVALIHRPDTYFYALPPIHEVYPHYFYNAEVIHKAQTYKQLYHGQYGNQYNEKTIYANYSGYYLNLHPEQALSYFTEDIGVNSFYYYYNLYYPFWMSGEEFNLKNDHRGELFYYIYQQILARYYLERLSNGFGEIDYFNWDVPFETGYYSTLVYPNGLQFPSRPNYAHLYEYFYNYGQHYGNNKYAYSYSFVQDYERRIRDAVDSGFVHTPTGQTVGIFTQEGINVLGNLIEGNPDSPYYQYYGAYQVFARHLLGYSHQPLSYHKTQPSALEHFETSLRDPAFYQLYKKLILFFIRYKTQHYRHYTEKDLVFDGVQVHNVEFDKLVTYFDYDYADISNAVFHTPEEFTGESFKVQVAQQRLNHQPFTYKIYVDSQVETDAVVKVFLGPKYDEYGRYINLTENWLNFVQFDHFVYQLKSGQNVIARNSREIFNYMHDRTSYYQVYQRVMGYEQGSDFNNQFFFGFPQRFILPKGSYSGVPFQFYVIVYKYVPYNNQKSDNVFVGSGAQYVDAYPLGYPFDRPVTYEQLFYSIPNAYAYDAKVYHEESENVPYSHEYQRSAKYHGYQGDKYQGNDFHGYQASEYHGYPSQYFSKYYKGSKDFKKHSKAQKYGFEQTYGQDYYHGQQVYGPQNYAQDYFHGQQVYGPHKYGQAYGQQYGPGYHYGQAYGPQKYGYGYQKNGQVYGPQKYGYSSPVYGHEGYSSVYGHQGYSPVYGHQGYTPAYGHGGYSSAYGRQGYSPVYGHGGYSSVYGHEGYSPVYGQQYHQTHEFGSYQPEQYSQYHGEGRSYNYNPFYPYYKF